MLVELGLDGGEGSYLVQAKMGLHFLLQRRKYIRQCSKNRPCRLPNLAQLRGMLLRRIIQQRSFLFVHFSSTMFFRLFYSLEMELYTIQCSYSETTHPAQTLVCSQGLRLGELRQCTEAMALNTCFTTCGVWRGKATCQSECPTASARINRCRPRWRGKPNGPIQ